MKMAGVFYFYVSNLILKCHLTNTINMVYYTSNKEAENNQLEKGGTMKIYIIKNGLVIWLRR